MKQDPPDIQEVNQSISFIHYLEKNLRDDHTLRKGAQTRERIKIATAKTLEAMGYHSMRIVDITECAGISEGSFYVYFTDKKDASLTTLSTFIADFIDFVAPPGAVHAPFESIRAANRRWFKICRANAGLMRCIFQLGDDDADFDRLVQRARRQWYERISRNIRFDRRHSDGKAVLLTIYFLGSMMDEIVRKMIVFPDSDFNDLLEEWNADDASIADAASLIWMRVFDPSAKPPNDLAPAAQDIAKIMWI